MDLTPKDLGEIPSAPDRSNFKNPFAQTQEGNIVIGNFNISPIAASEKKETLAEAIRKESRDSGI